MDPLLNEPIFEDANDTFVFGVKNKKIIHMMVYYMNTTRKKCWKKYEK